MTTWEAMKQTVFERQQKAKKLAQMKEVGGVGVQKKGSTGVALAIMVGLGFVIYGVPILKQKGYL